jgi:hypothetical protein
MNKTGTDGQWCASLRQFTTAWAALDCMACQKGCCWQPCTAGSWSKQQLHSCSAVATCWQLTDPCLHVLPPPCCCCRWLDWDREYNAWKGANLPVSVSYQFLAQTQPPSAWSDPYGISYSLGFKFARHFGPTSGKGNVVSFEAGNEPCEEEGHCARCWGATAARALFCVCCLPAARCCVQLGDARQEFPKPASDSACVYCCLAHGALPGDYSAEFYTTLLRGFVDGLQAGDPAVKRLPCALQVG